MDKKLKTNKLKTGIIESLSHECRGILKDENGKVVFVDNALPLEKINYVITSNKKKLTQATALEILEESPRRVLPKCPYFFICGGCSLQHMESDYQIEIKLKILLEQLKHFGKVSPENILEPITGPEYGYRHKARMSVRYVLKKQKALIGFREKQKHYIVDMDHCKILHPKIGLAIKDLKDLIASLKIYNEIPQIEVAIGDNDCALVFRHCIEIDNIDEQKLIEYGKNNNIHIYLQPKGIDSIHKIWPKDNFERLIYSVNNINFHFHPCDFTQINPYINQKLIQKAITLLDLNKETDVILDLFCGLGNFSLSLAKHSKKVVGVEGSKLMVERAKENATLNKINNVEFYDADLNTDCSNQTWLQKKYNKILIDPPRTGALNIIHQIGKMNVKFILYVSCNPATLARDAGVLVNDYKYTMKYAGVMDMFPQTKHVESIALFTAE